MIQISRDRLPSWLRRSLPISSSKQTRDILDQLHLHTVCESADCPNRSECYACGTATFMILGDTCTRNCGFCAVRSGMAIPVDGNEPQRVALAARRMKLQYVVITSVTRDDLKDEGAGHFAKTIAEIKKEIPGVLIEVLVPDFHARVDLIQTVLDMDPAVFNHNLETVERLQGLIRPQASYQRSLKVLETAKMLNPGMLTKSGLMVGLGETLEEVYEAAKDLRSVGCDILTIGQYLRPSQQCVDVKSYLAPEIFQEMDETIRAWGFRDVFVGPYVRSSYHASEAYLNQFLNS